MSICPSSADENAARSSSCPGCSFSPSDKFSVGCGAVAFSCPFSSSCRLSGVSSPAVGYDSLKRFIRAASVGGAAVTDGGVTAGLPGFFPFSGAALPLLPSLPPLLPLLSSPLFSPPPSLSPPSLSLPLLFPPPDCRYQRVFTFLCPVYFLPPASFPVFAGVVGEYTVAAILFH